MRKLLKRLIIILKKKLIRPITRSHTSLNDLALGIGIGLFWTFTPLVGIQMNLVLITWVLFKYVLRINFDVIVGCALVWISNPFTMVPIYYAFYMIGFYVLSWSGNDIAVITFGGFKQTFLGIVNDENLGYLESIYLACRYLIVELGWPMIIGSLFVSVPIGVAGYFVSKPLIRNFRMLKAKRKNMTYEEWCARYEKKAELSIFKKKKLI